jgi:hypothetical protein
MHPEWICFGLRAIATWKESWGGGARYVAHGTYQDSSYATSWLKVKNPAYSQPEGRHELFEAKTASSPW